MGPNVMVTTAETPSGNAQKIRLDNDKKKQKGKSKRKAKFSEAFKP